YVSIHDIIPLFFSSCVLGRPSEPTLFPSTTLFRSAMEPVRQELVERDHEAVQASASGGPVDVLSRQSGRAADELQPRHDRVHLRSEERRVGKEGSTWGGRKEEEK